MTTIQLCLSRKAFFTLLNRLLFAALLFAAAIAPTQAQLAPTPLSKSDVLRLLSGDVPPARVAELAKERGIAFVVTPDTEAELRQAGADDSLLNALRALTPQTGGPAPGRARPYTNSPPAITTLTTQKDKLSYALGMNVGQSMRRESVDVDPSVFFQGMKDAMAGKQLLLSDADARAAITDMQNSVRKSREEKLHQQAEANKKQGQDFLAANRLKTGVVTLPSGLQYKILQAGTGPKPTLTDTVVCNYRGTLIDNTEFDSSYKRGQPATFGVNKLIKGFSEALQLMPVGSKWLLFIPPELAYGEVGGGNQIGPDATLIFEVELLSIQGN